MHTSPDTDRTTLATATPAPHTKTARLHWLRDNGLALEELLRAAAATGLTPADGGDLAPLVAAATRSIDAAYASTLALLRGVDAALVAAAREGA